MAFPAVAAAGIAAAGQLIGSGSSMYFQGKSNQATRDWNENMYHVQRAHAYEDWMKANDYNSPAAQKQRMIEAGLNPALMYGHGSVANTSQGAPRGGNVGAYKDQAPDTSGIGNALGSALGGYYDATIKQAQLENIAANTRKIEVETALGVINADTKQFDLGMKQELSDTTVAAAKQAVLNAVQDENIKRSTVDKMESEGRVRYATESERIKAVELANVLKQNQINLTQEQIQNLAQRTANLSQEGQLIQAKGEEIMGRIDLQWYQKQELRQKIDKLLYENDTKGAKDVIDRLMKLIPRK